MRRWIATALWITLTCLAFAGMYNVTHAQAPVLDRCLDYLDPFTPTEWERCVGNEFNKFPELGEELKDAYINAPPLRKWPEAETLRLGDGAPLVDFPYVDDRRQVYIAPPDSWADAVPFVLPEPPEVDIWWDQPMGDWPELPQTDTYTSWQNYWMTDGGPRYGGWAAPGGYSNAPW